MKVTPRLPGCSSLFFSMPMALIISSCGLREQKPMDPDKSGFINIPPQTIGEIDAFAKYPLVDKACLSSAASTTIKSAVVSSFEKDRILRKSLPLSDVIARESLASPYIKGTTFGAAFQTDCKGELGDRSNCAEETTIIRPSYPLKICRETADYVVNSFEDVAVTTFVHLNNFLIFHDRIRSSQDQLPPLELSIMPSITYKYETGKTERADNISYYPALFATPAIVVLPRGRISDKLWPNFDLWDSPWIVGHEGAHHVFRSYISRKNGANLYLANALDDSEAVSRPNEDFADSATDSATIAYLPETVSAVNESFADLLSFFALGADSRYLNDLPCVGKNRAITSATFSDGQKKELTASRLALFYSTDTSNALPCDANFRDHHIIGAILAHAIYSLFYETVKQQPAAQQPDILGKMTLTWLKRMKTVEVDKNTDAKTVLRMLLAEAVKTAAGGGSQLTARQCTVIRSVLPIFADSLLTPGGSFRCAPNL
jgi:hypothetical protein